MSRARGSLLRTRLSRIMVGLGLTSVVLLATVNFFIARSLLDSNARDQLVTLRDLRRDGIELAVDRLLARVSVLAREPGVALALVDLDAGYRQLVDELSPDQLDQLAASYSVELAPYDAARVDRPSIEELVPASTAGRHVQYHYLVANESDRADRDQLVDAGDESAYSSAHATHHDFLRTVGSGIGVADLLLVSANSGEVVYSTAKRIDLGTDIVTGPHAASGLGETWARLGTAAVDDAVVADSAFYLPDSAVPIVHVAATVRIGAEVVGALVIALRIDALTDLVTAGQQWDRLGLGETGDAYVIGGDARFRTVPRTWFADPEAYLARYRSTGGDARAAELMEFTGSPVLLHEIDNAAVVAASAGGEFVGVVANPLGRRALTAAAPLDLPGLDWSVVTEQQTRETRVELERFLATIGVVLAVLLPILAITGVLLGRALARPVGPLVAAAREIAAGQFDPDVPDLGKNEFGDLGRQLEHVALRLREQEESIANEEVRITNLLASVLPPVLIDRVRRGDLDVTEVVDTATVIAISLCGLPEPSGTDDVLDVTARLARDIDELLAEHAVERIRLAPDLSLFVAGRGRPGTASEVAVAFAVAAVDRVAAIAADFDLALTARAGLSAGPVATGMLGSRQTTFGIWGDSVGRSIDLSLCAPDGAVVVDATVADQLPDDSIEEFDPGTASGPNPTFVIVGRPGSDHAARDASGTGR